MAVSSLLQSYVSAALWCCDDNGIPLMTNYSIQDIELHSLNRMNEEINQFVKKAKQYCGEYIDLISDDNMGHDFWLSRNGHGTNFKYRSYADEKILYVLHAIAKEFGECSLYLGDDKVIYLFSEVKGISIPNLDDNEESLNLFLENYDWLVSYCRLKLRSTVLRKSGRVKDAIEAEAIANNIYKRLPQSLRW